MKPPLPDRLARTCLDHLDEEEAHLSRTLSSLQEIRAAFIKNDADALDVAVQQQAQGSQSLERLRQRRDALRESAAQGLGVPAKQVTVERLAASVSVGDRAMLLASRRRLKELVRQVERHQRLLLSLAEDFHGVLEQVFSCLAGDAADASCYGPKGSKLRPACGSVLQARG